MQETGVPEIKLEYSSVPGRFAINGHGDTEIPSGTLSDLIF